MKSLKKSKLTLFHNNISKFCPHNIWNHWKYSTHPKTFPVAHYPAGYSLGAFIVKFGSFFSEYKLALRSYYCKSFQTEKLIEIYLEPSSISCNHFRKNWFSVSFKQIQNSLKKQISLVSNFFTFLIHIKSVRIWPIWHEIESFNGSSWSKDTMVWSCGDG